MHRVIEVAATGGLDFGPPPLPTLPDPLELGFSEDACIIAPSLLNLPSNPLQPLHSSSPFPFSSLPLLPLCPSPSRSGPPSPPSPFTHSIVSSSTHTSFSSAQSQIEIAEGAAPTILKNKIYSGLGYGFYIHDGGGAVFEVCGTGGVPLDCFPRGGWVGGWVPRGAAWSNLMFPKLKKWASLPEKIRMWSGVSCRAAEKSICGAGGVGGGAFKPPKNGGGVSGQGDL